MSVSCSEEKPEAVQPAPSSGCSWRRSRPCSSCLLHSGAGFPIALADGRLYYRTENGPVLLVEPSPKGYIEHGRFDQPDRSQSMAWAHPVIANGKVYIIDQDNLFCYDVKAR